MPQDSGIKKLQSNPIKTDTERVIESVRINGVSVLSGLNFKKNVRAFYPQGQSKLSVLAGLSLLSGLNLKKM